MGAVACGNPLPGVQAAMTNTTAAVRQGAPAAGVAATTPPGADWFRPAGDFSSTRYSPLADITAASVHALAVTATFDTGNARGHEAAPDRYRWLLETVHGLQVFAGFCYTRFADTYQEANGLLRADRTPRFPMEEIYAATSGLTAPAVDPDPAGGSPRQLPPTDTSEAAG
jgi:hypothetical protein